LEELNAAAGTAFADWSQVRPPQREWHYRDFLARRGELRREFLLRNYITVIDYVALRGRALWNTAIYCGLAVLCALVVNPLAAYALSRWRRPSAYQVLLFLMLTMAFPPMVTQIPVFLMLRKLDLLNTFWALILPGLANGYSIFLLKGFFDSHPRELYESAEIDGAGELRMFWHLALRLSAPILAVVALNAFVHAYSNFMFALLICQDERMWTVMPWLYQLQQTSGPGVVYASLVVAAVPTLLVFAFCQNIILRGIVIPVEK
jgi:multiple sugar transport system permease protein